MNRIALLAFLVPLFFAFTLVVLNRQLGKTQSNNARADIHDSVQASSISKPVNSLASTSDGSLTGVASVIDGDTIKIHGVRIRLHGIDAPESGQLCKANGNNYRCGQLSSLFLQDTIGRSVVTCEAHDTDRYGRAIATCSVDGADVGAAMVASGWALAYRRYDDIYVRQEEEAESSGLGMWQGEFIEPARWRAGEEF